MAKELEAADIELKEYSFMPSEIKVNGQNIIDYTEVEHDKIFLVNKKDIGTKAPPRWLPLFYKKTLRENDFLPSCVKDKATGYYYVLNNKTVYRMTLDVLVAAIDYYLKREKVEGEYKDKIMLPKALKSMSKRRYNEIASLLPLCECYKSDFEKYALDAVNLKRGSEAYRRQNIIIFQEQYQPLLEAVKGKRLDLNYSKQDYIDSYSKGEGTSYGDGGCFNNLYGDYGIKIKKQNGSTFSKEQVEKMQNAVEKVWKHYGNLKELSDKYGLKISYADNCMQHARQKAIGLFTPYYNAIGVSFFDDEKQKKMGVEHTTDVTLSHEVAHWLDAQKGKELHHFFASDKDGTLENRIATLFKEEVKKRDGDSKQASKIGKSDHVALGEYWFRTCECFARAMEQAYAMEQGIDLSWEKTYASKSVFEKEIKPLVDELTAENAKKFGLELKSETAKQNIDVYGISTELIYKKVCEKLQNEGYNLLGNGENYFPKFSEVKENFPDVNPSDLVVRPYEIATPSQENNTNNFLRPLRIGNKVIARNNYNGEIIKGKIDDFDGHYSVYIRDDEYIRNIERRNWTINLDKGINKKVFEIVSKDSLSEYELNYLNENLEFEIKNERSGLSAKSYYNSKGTRKICHDIKKNDGSAECKEAVEKMADYIAGQGIIDENSVLIPAPQHTGKAQYTFAVAMKILNKTNATVADVLRCKPHETLYEQKKNGEETSLKLFLTGNIDDIIKDKKVFLIDNVISTGLTFNKAAELIPGLIPAPYAISNFAEIEYENGHFVVNNLLERNVEQSPEMSVEEYTKKHSLATSDILNDEILKKANRNILKEVEDYIKKGIRPENDRFIIGKTPLVLQKTGSDITDVTVPVSVVKKAVETHGLSALEITDSLVMLYNPVLIFDSDKDATENKVDSKLILTDIFKDEKPIALAVNVNSAVDINNRGLTVEVQDIRSIHDRTVVAKNGTDLIQKWANDGLCRYVDDEKITDWSTVARVYFPIELLQSDNSNILTKSALVNMANSEQTQKETTNKSEINENKNISGEERNSQQAEKSSSPDSTSPENEIVEKPYVLRGIDENRKLYKMWGTNELSVFLSELEPNEKTVKAFNKWLKEHENDYIRLYHGTSSKNDESIEKEGIRVTTKSRRKSYQSQSGYVYLSRYPTMAKTFGEMNNAYYNTSVYACDIKIKELKSDTDQLRNKRLYGINCGDSLAESLIIGSGVRIKRDIQPYEFSKIQFREISKINDKAVLYSENQSGKIIEEKLSIDENKLNIKEDEQMNEEKAEITNSIAENEQAVKDSKFLMETYGDKKAVDAACKKVSISDFVSTDETRYFMNGIFYENGFAIATNGKILIKQKKDYPAEWEGKIIHPQTGKEIDGQFPAYKNLFNNRENLVDRSSRLAHISNYLSMATTGIALSQKSKYKFHNHNTPVVFENTLVNSRHLQIALAFARDKGFNKVYQEDNYEFKTESVLDEDGNEICKYYNMDEKSGSELKHKYYSYDELPDNVKNAVGTVESDNRTHILCNVDGVDWFYGKVEKTVKEYDRDPEKLLTRMIEFSAPDGSSILVMPVAETEASFIDKDGILRNYEENDFIKTRLLGKDDDFYKNIVRTLLKTSDFADADVDGIYKANYEEASQRQNSDVFPKNKKDCQILAMTMTYTDAIGKNLDKTDFVFAKGQSAATFQQFVCNMWIEQFKDYAAHPERLFLSAEKLNPKNIIDMAKENDLIKEKDFNQELFAEEETKIEEKNGIEESIADSSSVFAKDDLTVSFNLYASSLASGKLEELKEHLSSNGYTIEWNDEKNEFRVSYDDAAYIRTILEERDIEYSDRMGLISFGYDGKWIDDPLDVEIVSENEFKGLQEMKERNFKELNLPYIKISDNNERSYDKYIRGETILSIAEADDILPELNEKWEDGHFKTDFTMYLPDKAGWTTYEPYRYEMGSDTPLGTLSDNLHRLCSVPEVIELFEKNWKRVYAPTVTEEQEKAVAETIKPLKELLENSYKQRLNELSETMKRHGKDNSGFIVEEEKVASSDAEVKAVQDKISNIFDESLKTAVRQTSEYVMDAKDSLNVIELDELNAYVAHSIVNMIEDAEYGESRNSSYEQDFDFAAWRKSLEPLCYDADLTHAIEELREQYIDNLSVIKKAEEVEKSTEEKISLTVEQWRACDELADKAKMGWWAEEYGGDGAIHGPVLKTDLDSLSTGFDGNLRISKENEIIVRKLFNDNGIDFSETYLLSSEEANAKAQNLYGFYFEQSDFGADIYRSEDGDWVGTYGEGGFGYTDGLDGTAAPKIPDEIFRDVISLAEQFFHECERANFPEQTQKTEMDSVDRWNFIEENLPDMEFCQRAKNLCIDINSYLDDFADFGSTVEDFNKFCKKEFKTDLQIENYRDTLEETLYDTAKANADYEKAVVAGEYNKTLDKLEKIANAKDSEELVAILKESDKPEISVGETVTVSLQQVYEHLAKKNGTFFFNESECVNLYYGGTIERDDDSMDSEYSHYDMYAKDGTLLCCDGEEITYAGIDEKTGLHTFTNPNNDSQYLIAFSDEELRAATQTVSLNKELEKSAMEADITEKETESRTVAVEKKSYDIPLEVLERSELTYAGSDKTSGITYKVRIDDKFKKEIAPSLRDLKENEHLILNYRKWFNGEESERDFSAEIMRLDNGGDWSYPDELNTRGNVIRTESIANTAESNQVKESLKKILRGYEEKFLAEKSAGGVSAEISDKENAVLKKPENTLPFSIIENIEKGRVNIKFDSVKITNFKDIVKEIKEEGWKFAPSTKQWYPVGNAVKNANEFAKNLQEKYSVNISSVREMNPAETSEIAKENNFISVKSVIKNTNNENAYKDIKFFDRNYRESEEFMDYFNSRLPELNGNLQPISEKQASVILHALNHDNSGFISQRKNRLGIDKDNNFVVFTKEGSMVKTVKTDLQGLLQFAREQAERNLEDAKITFEKFKSREKNYGSDLQIYFRIFMRTVLRQVKM